VGAVRERALDALRALAARRPVAPLLAVYRGAPTVRPALLCALRELLRRRGLAYYRVRESGYRVAIRHGAAAVWVLAEVFSRHCYEPHGEAAAALERPQEILDLGANIGLFGVYAAARWPQARIVAFEPDRDNAALLALTIAANDLAGRWELVRAAASNRDGRVAFAAGLNASSHVADAGSGEPAVEVEMLDVLPRIAQADLLKMDIEGGEWAILGDPRFAQAPPRVLVLEYHPHMCPGPDPRAEAGRALAAAGMRVHPVSDRGDGHGVMWAVRA
jgi:FkbM family methyltransferase